MAALDNSKDAQVARVSSESWNELVEALADGRLSVFEVLSGELVSDGDHDAFINRTRASFQLLSDRRIAQRLLEELLAKITEKSGDKADLTAFNRQIESRDGHRLFEKLSNVRSELYSDGPSLLPQGTFSECHSAYGELLGYVEALWDDACKHFIDGKYPLAAFLAILAIEETGKLGRVWHDLLAWDRPLPATRSDLGQLGRDHRKKHFMGVISGALINARLDRILGKKQIKALLQEVDSGKLEAFRQSCLYIDISDGKVSVPAKRVNRDKAQFYVVLAGELWAEVLGHFPWDFRRMIGKVIAFEKTIGIPADIAEAS